MKRLGVDVGGTFTDLIYVDDDGDVSVHKVPSTPADPSAATLQGALELCATAGVEPAEIDQFFHGTTVATNIIIEHNGAEVGLITTRGFRDILHIARHKKPLNWSNFQDLPWQTLPAREAPLPNARDRARHRARRGGAGATRRGRGARRGPGAQGTRASSRSRSASSSRS